MPIEYPSDRVARELRSRVESGEWKPGERIPSVAVLADQHHTSKATASKAVGMLAEQGLLTVLPHYGTFVAES